MPVLTLHISISLRDWKREPTLYPAILHSLLHQHQSSCPWAPRDGASSRGVTVNLGCLESPWGKNSGIVFKNIIRELRLRQGETQNIHGIIPWAWNPRLKKKRKVEFSTSIHPCFLITYAMWPTILWFCHHTFSSLNCFCQWFCHCN